MAAFMGNISEMGMNTTYSPIETKPTNVVLAVFNLMFFLVGTAINGLFLWVLVVKMERTVTILWFRHLILIFLIICSIQPFFAVYFLLGFHWIFGTVLCKIFHVLFSLGMFFEVFLLTIISLDRYIAVCHPFWSQHNRTIPRAQRLLAGTWLVSLAFSIPYLIFRETREVKNGRIKCENNYAFFQDSEKAHRIHLALFVTRFLLAFLLPFLIITSCSYQTGQEIEKRRLVKRTGKTFKILVTSAASFFICWLPYHLYHALLLAGEVRDGVRQVLIAVMGVGICFNCCFTSIFYLFVGEKFQQVFKTSIVSLLQNGFAESSFVSVDKENTAEKEDKQLSQFAA